MSTDRTFEGKDLAEALATAASRMGIAEPDLDYEIVEAGRRGLFGFGAKSVRIRVMPPLDQEFAAADSRSKRGGRSTGQPATGGNAAPAAAGEDGAEGEPRRRRRRRRGRRSGAGKEREGRAEGAPREPRDQQPIEIDAAAIAAEVKADDSPAAPQEAVDQVQEQVQKMIAELGFDLEVRAKPVPGGTEIEFDGADEDLLIADDAEPIAAFQFLLNRMSRRGFPDAGRIQVYCNGHRETRDEDLVELARQTAEKVLDGGEPLRLRPMNSYERRLVHMTVRKLRGVDSRSEGDGAMKRVRVFKRRRRRRPRPARSAN
jgi:spoIIIJ-associated protein